MAGNELSNASKIGTRFSVLSTSRLPTLHIFQRLCGAKHAIERLRNSLGWTAPLGSAYRHRGTQMNDQRIPNLYIVGAPKCGTTAISSYLASHPDVYLGYPKEPSYWSTDLAHTGTVAPVDSYEKYLAVYRHAGSHRILLDASTRYLFSDCAIPAIWEAQPDARFIVAVRPPVDLAHAYHMEKVFNRFEPILDFEEAWRLQGERARGQALPTNCHEPRELQYRQVASVGSQLERMLSHVPTERILIVFLEDWVNSAGTVWQSILNFADLPSDGRVNFPILGGAHAHRFPVIARLYQNPPRQLQSPIRGIKQLLRESVAADQLRELLIRREQRTSLRPDFANELTAVFESEVHLVEKLTGRNLEHWLRQ